MFERRLTRIPHGIVKLDDLDDLASARSRHDRTVCVKSVISSVKVSIESVNPPKGGAYLSD
jgi:hypothetical protein